MSLMSGLRTCFEYSGDSKIYVYSVKFEPEISDKETRLSLSSIHHGLFKDEPRFDGEILESSSKCENKIELYSYVDDFLGEKRIILKIKFEFEKETSPPPSLQSQKSPPTSLPSPLSSLPPPQRSLPSQKSLPLSLPPRKMEKGRLRILSNTLRISRLPNNTTKQQIYTVLDEVVAEFNRQNSKPILCVNVSVVFISLNSKYFY